MEKRKSSNVRSIHGSNSSTKTSNSSNTLKPSTSYDETTAKLQSDSYKKSLNKIQKKAEEIEW